MQGPLLAATNPVDVYEAIHGPVAPIDVTVPSFQANPSAGALNQLDYDAQWMSYAQQMNQQNSATDTASIQAAQAAYNAATGSDTAANGGQYDPAKVQALNAALDDMIEANGWSFGPARTTSADNIPTLDTINVTAQAVTTQAPIIAQSDLALFAFGQGAEFNLGETSDNVSEALALADIGLKGTAQEGALSILNNAAPLQQARMTDISRATTMEDLEGVVSDTSKSGRLIAAFAKASNVVVGAGLIADGVTLISDVQNAQTDQVPLVVAQDTSSFAAEAASILVGAETGAAIGAGLGLYFGWTGPVFPFVEAGLSIAGGVAGALGYNSYLKEPVKNVVSTLVHDMDNSIENAPTEIRSDLKTTENYLRYIFSNPKGPYTWQ